MKSYRDLLVWQRGIELVKEIYAVTKEFPEKERFGLTNQLERAVVSVPSNIAEGQARNSDKDFARFLRMALGSLAEVDTQIEIAKELTYISEEDTVRISGMILELRKMLFGLINSLTKNSK